MWAERVQRGEFGINQNGNFFAAHAQLLLRRGRHRHFNFSKRIGFCGGNELRRERAGSRGERKQAEHVAAGNGFVIHDFSGC